MEVLIWKIIILIIIQLMTYSNDIDYDEGCYLDDSASLQVAFAIYQPGTFPCNAHRISLLQTVCCVSTEIKHKN